MFGVNRRTSVLTKLTSLVKGPQGVLIITPKSGAPLSFITTPASSPVFDFWVQTSFTEILLRSLPRLTAAVFHSANFNQNVARFESQSFFPDFNSSAQLRKSRKASSQSSTATRRQNGRCCLSLTSRRSSLRAWFDLYFWCGACVVSSLIRKAEG